MDLWFQLLLYFISLITLFIEIYVIWLILYKTTQKMQSFRYHLMSLMVNEVGLTISIAVIIDPDLLFSNGVQGGFANGVSRFLGVEGGRYGFAIAFFFGAGVFCEQIACLMFRYTAIQQKYDNLNKNFRSNSARAFLFVLGNFIKAFAAYLAYISMASSEEVHKIFQTIGDDNKQYLNTFPDNTAFIVLTKGIGLRIFGIFIAFGYGFVSILSIVISVMIYHTIRANAIHFTAKTYKLHLQLTALLIVQFCLPFIFLIGPVIYAFYLAFTDSPSTNTLGNSTLIFLSLYTLANSLATLLFVGPYRDFTLQLFRLKKVMVQKPPPKTTQIEVNRISIGHTNLNLNGANLGIGNVREGGGVHIQVPRVVIRRPTESHF